MFSFWHSAQLQNQTNGTDVALQRLYPTHQSFPLFENQIQFQYQLTDQDKKLGARDKIKYITHFYLSRISLGCALAILEHKTY